MDIQADNTIDRGSIAQTERLIRPHVRRTPVIEVDAADFGLAAASLSFKLELLQHAGSFKTRGAFANLLTREIPQAGVVAASRKPWGGGGLCLDEPRDTRKNLRARDLITFENPENPRLPRRIGRHR